MEQKHIAIFNIPAHGHINPTLALTKKLVERGYRVTYPVTDEFVAAIEETGAEPLQYRSTLNINPQTIREMMKNKEDMPQAPKMFMKEVEEVLPQLEELYQHDRPDLIVYDFMAMTGKLIAEKLGVEAVRLCSTYAQNEHFQFKDLVERMQIEKVGQQVSDLKNANFSTARFEELFEPAKLNIVFMPRAFQPYGDTFDERFRFVGPSLAERKFQNNNEQLVKDDGRPVMLISLGTAFNAWSEFYSMCIDAFRDTKWQVIMSVGAAIDPESFEDIPDNFSIRQSVPQLEILKKAKLFITHGGMNSTMEALNEGVPLVVIPQMPEQEMTARRVEELGLGRHLQPEATTVQRLQEAVSQVDDNTELLNRVKDMQENIKEAGGAEKAADEIEAFFKPITVN
ncbi:glycosyltransferase [Bacillus sonorensis]|uniref:UDP-glucosyltransferase YjiC n=2 Tax=Bacillus sonorensis TaxID=119858 RepID=M5NZE1_9BACI|nr:MULTISPECIES: macrolide family glycosyltransferase [Bacillus]TWK84131.1 Demethyllactenocin mycarosyltransferase [Bacillus paralicheniformis]ASB89458.1 Demethyllactenocin mycarosyltransferase [Bacillus sonorensis]EME72574.1 UDP-glucosyltransferase YjiC [Bacillus sonorensis L12]MCF7618735.1 UDP-glucosyltransferase [Bacillus sonorensis]MCY8026771.1 UDP-glucosyltransferase [Bacillus sonorensis]